MNNTPTPMTDFVFAGWLKSHPARLSHSKLERELAEAKQIMGELCDDCGWAMRFPGQPCRCELERERDDLLSRLTAIEHSMPDELARLEQQRDRLVEALDELYDAMVRYEGNNDGEAPSEHHRMMRRVRKALAAVKGGKDE
jgi:hypothetical protein